MVKKTKSSTRKQKFDPFKKRKGNIKPKYSIQAKPTPSLDEKITISRKNIKGKYFVVAKRKDKILDKMPWSQKTRIDNLSTTKIEKKKVVGINLNQARTFYQENRSLNPLIQKFHMTKVVEVTDFSPSPRKPRGAKRGQYVVEGKFKNGTTLSARSMKIGADSVGAKTKELAKKTAWENFWRLLSEKFGGDYSVSSGKAFDNKVVSYREGMVFYVDDS